MTTAALSPIQCAGCGAPLPLAEPAPEVACPYCGEASTLPAEYLAAADIRRRAAEARRRAEPLWKRLDSGSDDGQGAAGCALILVVLLPPIVTLLGLLLPTPSLNTAEVTALFTLPAVLPGAGLWVWGTAVHATTLRFRAALTARPASRADGPPECRSCGAPLAAEPDALAATCGYCGTDSLLQEISIEAVSERLRAAMTSLQDAVSSLKTRRAIIGLGIAGVLAVFGGSSALLGLALSHID